MTVVAGEGGVSRLLRISRNVADLARAAAFHCDALGFSVERESTLDGAWTQLMGLPDARARALRLRLGAQTMELVAFDVPGRPYPHASGSADLWFQHLALVVADMPAAYAQLCRHPFEPISDDGPQQLPPDTGAVTAFKFRDPDGHPLELIQFPSGIGDPCWQQRPGLFLGIDHSAIAVVDTDRTVDFYTRLGLHVSARSCNTGPTQQRLDHLPEVAVDVVAMQPAQPGPPHVELLGYRRPRGRALADSAANDIAADRLVLETGDLTRLLQRLATTATTPSFGMIATEKGNAALLRDPAGHRLVILGSSAMASEPGGETPE